MSPRPADKVRYSPEIQEQKCRAWCDERGISVVGVIADILVSGGSPTRFDSILRSLQVDQPTHFVVSDISRWTRDRPSRFWAMQELLESQGVKLVAVDQDYLNQPDMPFMATLTTAHVEMGYQERMILKKKTSDGLRAARAKGKRWGKIWGWHKDENNTWVIDEPRIRLLYQMVIDQRPFYEIARQLNCPVTSITSHIRAESQKDVVGEEMWLRANDVLSRRNRAPKRGSKRSSIFRGLLICPCGSRMNQVHLWGNYRCPRGNDTFDHRAFNVSAVRHVMPAVRQVLDQIIMPEDDVEALRIASQPMPDPVVPDPATIREEMDRIALAWASKRMSDSVYERRMSELEAQLEDVIVIPPRPPEEQVEIVTALRTINLMDREPYTGDQANLLLKELLHPIRLGWDRKPVEIRVREEYLSWMRGSFGVQPS